MPTEALTAKGTVRGVFFSLGTTLIMAGTMKEVGIKNMGDLSDPRIAITWP